MIFNAENAAFLAFRWILADWLAFVLAVVYQTKKNAESNAYASTI